MQEIYLDNAATTKVLESSAELSLKIMTESYGNPSSVHSLGFQAEMLLKRAKKDILDAAGANEKEYNLIFTPSGTLSDNLAVLGAARLLTKKGNRILMGDSEHPAVFACKEELENLGYEVILIPNRNGKIDLDFVRNNLNEKTVLISHMLVNNETGALYDIKRLCKIRDEISPKCLVHTDAVQAFLKTEKKIAQCKADLISVSSHKVHAPKGAGALIFKKTVRLSPVIFGGGQGDGLVSGTEPLPAICAFANSCKIYSQNSGDNLAYIEKLYDYASKSITNNLPGIIINKPENFSPYIMSISVPKVKSEVLLRFLSEKGIYVSAGSACSSKSRENRVLKNYGISKELSDCTIRISFSEDNTVKDIDSLVLAILEATNSLAKIK